MSDTSSTNGKNEFAVGNQLNRKRKPFISNRPLHLMMLGVVVLLFVYRYLPMIGIYIAFIDFDIFLGRAALLKSEWVGLQNYRDILEMGEPVRVFFNTFEIAFLKIVFGLLVPIVFALLLNEVRRSSLKRLIQTVVYLPHFMSWVIVGGIAKEIFSSQGVFNQLTALFGADPVSFLQSNTYFVPLVILTHVWKEFGFSTIVYLAAIANIDPNLYEAAIVDGATRMQQTRYITIPGMKPIIILTIVLALRGILNAGFDQIFNLYSVAVYETGDVISTFVYRLSFESTTPQYSISTAIGLFKSVIGLTLIVGTNQLAKRWANYSVF